MTFISGTSDSGRLHLGIYSHDSATYAYGRSINTYNNIFTKFFTRLFGFATTIEIGGKIRTVNKKSFAKHAEFLGLEPSITPEAYLKYLNSLKRIPYGLLPLTNDLSPQKQEKYFNRMIEGLSARKVNIVSKMIRKGASTTKKFLIEEKTHVSNPHDSSVGKTFYECTPLSFAVHNGCNYSAERIVLFNRGIKPTDTFKTFSPNKPILTRLVTRHNTTLSLT